MNARAINLPTIQVALIVSLSNRLLKELKLSQQALSAGWLLQQFVPETSVIFPAGCIGSSGRNVASDEHDSQLAAPAAAGAGLDACNTGTNCNIVSEGDTTDPTGCAAERVLLARDFKWCHPFLISSYEL
jgi:hypothetical protein